VAEGERPDALDAARLAAAAEEVAQAGLRLDPAALAEALDPAACARERRQRGSSAPSEVTAMLAAAEDAATAGLEWSARERARTDAAAAALRAAAAAVAAGGA
jgi:hypothetical protein